MSFILALQGYVVALVALYVAFAPKRRRMPRLMRPALCWVAFVAAAVSTFMMAKIGGAGAVHFVSLVCSFVTALAAILWLFFNVFISLQRPPRRPRPANIDFSFLETAANDPNASDSAAGPQPRAKLDHHRWIKRLQKLTVFHRWSFLTDPPQD